MPAMTYRLRWPDQRETECYSPSLVIRDFFEAGGTYSLEAFLIRLREATAIASSRVQAKYGFPCSRALGQLQAIEQMASGYRDRSDASVHVVSFGDAI